MGAAKAMGKDRRVILTRKARCSVNWKFCSSNVFWAEVKGQRSNSAQVESQIPQIPILPYKCQGKNKVS